MVVYSEGKHSHLWCSENADHRSLSWGLSCLLSLLETWEGDSMHSFSFPGDTKSARLFQSGAGTALGYLTEPWCLQGENLGDRDGQKDETSWNRKTSDYTYYNNMWITKRWSTLPSMAASHLWRLLCPQGMKPCTSIAIWVWYWPCLDQGSTPETL